MGTDENLFRVSAGAVLRLGAQVLPLELVPVPVYGAQICAQASTKGYVQTGARAPSLNQALVGPIISADGEVLIFRGLQPVPNEEVFKIYEGTHLAITKINPSNFLNVSLHWTVLLLCFDLI